jgi:uncharacterized membrane protein YfcA
MTLAQHALFLLCVGAAGYVQNLTGFAFGLVLLGLVGILHLAPLPDVANVVSVLTLVNAAMLFRTHRPQVERAVMAPTLAASLVGVVGGVLALNWLSDHVVAGLRLLLGLTIVGCAVVLVLDAAPLRQRSGPRAFAAVGLVAGVLGGLFSTAGPPLVYHFYRQPMALRAIRDSLVTAFACNAVVRIALMLATARFAADVLWLALEAAPLVLAQTWWMARRPQRWSERALKRIVSALLMAVGAGLAMPALRAM